MKNIKPDALEVPTDYPFRVSYVGTRDELLAAGVAVPAMFPDHPATRRWSASNAKWQGIVADDFSVTLRPDGRWRVTRANDWEDPAAVVRRRAEWEAERARLYMRLCERADEQLTDPEPEPMTIARYRDSLNGHARSFLAVLSMFLAGDAPWCQGYRLRDADGFVARLRELEADIAVARIEGPPPRLRLVVSK